MPHALARLLLLLLLSSQLLACSTERPATSAASATPAPASPTSTPAPQPSATPAPASPTSTPQPTATLASPTATPAPASVRLAATSVTPALPSAANPSAPASVLVYTRDDGSLWRAEGSLATPTRLSEATSDGLLPWAAAPDGASLAMVRSVGLNYKAPSDEASAALWLLDADGRNARQVLSLLPPEPLDLTPGGDAAFNLVPAITSRQELAWSPDGSLLAFVSAHEGQVDLYITSSDGTLSRLTNTPEIEQGPAWSPDGSLLAYRTTSGFGTGAGWGDPGLAVVAISGGAPLLSLKPTLASGFPPMAVGELAWATADTLVISLPGFRGDDSEIRTVAVDATERTLFSGTLGGLSWNQPSSTLAIAVDQPSGDEAALTAPGLYLWNPGDEAPRNLFANPLAGPPRWSPTSDALAVTTSGDAQPGVWLVPLSGEPVRVTSDYTPYTAWAPDGSLLAAGSFVANRGGDTVYTLPGTEPQPLGWGAAGLFFASGDGPDGSPALRLWNGTESRFLLDGEVAPWSARVVPLRPLPPAAAAPSVIYAAIGREIVAYDFAAQGQLVTAAMLPEEVEAVYSLSRSPAGQLLADTFGSAGANLYLVNLNDRAARRLTDGQVDEDLLAWAPDSSWLLLSSLRDSARGCEGRTCYNDLYRLDLIDGSTWPLTITADAETAGTIAPAGRSIAFSRGCLDIGNDACGPRLFIAKPDGTGEREIAGSTWALDPVFSPDSGSLLYREPGDGGVGLWLTDFAGTLRQLTSGVGKDWLASFAPDGRQVAFVRISGECQVESCSYGVYLIDTAGGEPQLRYAGGEPAGVEGLRWAADGSGLLLTVRSRQGLSLLTIAADGSRVAELPLALPAGWTAYAF